MNLQNTMFLAILSILAACSAASEPDFPISDEASTSSGPGSSSSSGVPEVEGSSRGGCSSSEGSSSGYAWDREATDESSSGFDEADECRIVGQSCLCEGQISSPLECGCTVEPDGCVCEGSHRPITNHPDCDYVACEVISDECQCEGQISKPQECGCEIVASGQCECNGVPAALSTCG